jgi:putative CocE/NonD family hydrolase
MLEGTACGTLVPERTTMAAPKVAGVEPGQRRLNGPQTTGREFRNLSEPRYDMLTELDVKVPMRDGAALLADVMRPETADRVPALVAASCYPRQIQNTGAPLGFVEAGASDFWVPRGYAHVIANVRGTGGSDGTYSLLGADEQEDLGELVEWAAAQPWCDGNVGMIGLSYFGMTQVAAAGQRPPHLKAIFPGAASTELYEAVWHNGLLSMTFVSGWMAGVGILADKGDRLFRNRVVDVAQKVLRTDRVHAKFEHLNGEAAVSALGKLMRAKYDSDPFDQLWTEMVSRPVRDEWWSERNLADAADRIEVPVYLSCDWENVPLHLPSTFLLWKALDGKVPLQMGLLGKNGLTWPWESFHVEALAWFDHWLKGADTGILEGPPIRYWLPGADEFHTADTWPPPGTTLQELALRADGALNTDPGPAGERSYLFLPPNVTRPKGAPQPELPPVLTWQTEPLAAHLDMVGEIELVLEATTSALDAHWIVTLQDVHPDGSVDDVTAGWLRASLRALDEAASRPGAPQLLLTHSVPVEPRQPTTYRIPLVPNARRFLAGHRIRLVITSDDRSDEAPAMMQFEHACAGDASVNTILSGSRLLLPVLEGGSNAD